MNRPARDAVADLEAELDAMREARDVQEQVIADGYAQMDVMLVDLERKADALQEASKAANAATAVLDRILDTMHGALMVVGMDGRIRQVNAELCRLVGRTREELLGAEPEPLFVLGELEALAGRARMEFPSERSVVRIFGHPRAEELDGHLVAADGRRLPHFFRSGVLRGPQDKQEGVVIVGNDVRELKETMDGLATAHAGMKRVLDNIDQGLLTIDRAGVVGASRSARVAEWFGALEPGRTLWELAERFQPGRGWLIEMGLLQLADGFMPVEVCLAQLQTTLRRNGTILDVVFHPVGDPETFESLLVVVTDVTARVAADEAERARQEFLTMVERILTDRDYFLQFFDDASGLVGSICCESDPTVQFRLVHTLKGNASVFGVESLAEVCHGVESRLAAEYTALTGDEVARIQTAWARVVEQVGRFVVDAGDNICIPQKAYRQLVEELQRHPQLENLAQEVALWRHPPVEAQLRRVGLQAERIAATLGREVRVEVDCDGTRLPEEGWSNLWSSLVNWVRNALDHGIEPVEVRTARGKPPWGGLRLVARSEGNGFSLAASDDGGGVDWDAIREQGQRLGLPVATAAELTDALFADGVSSRRDVTALSGRGVGTAALKAAVDGLGGSLSVESTAGVGTRYVFWFPEVR